MGLDMYLVEKKSKYVGLGNMPDNSKLTEALKESLGTDDSSCYHVIVEQERIYWRKSNAIHQWFVDNVQDGDDDCGEYPVTCQQLATLRDTCNKILEDPENSESLAEELLPTKSGFFFGSVDYDDGYIADLEYTVSSIDRLLKEFNWDTPDFTESPDLYYQSSW